LMQRPRVTSREEVATLLGILTLLKEIRAN
jgi:hypothetical protein